MLTTEICEILIVQLSTFKNSKRHGCSCTRVQDFFDLTWMILTNFLHRHYQAHWYTWISAAICFTVKLIVDDIYATLNVLHYMIFHLFVKYFFFWPKMWIIIMYLLRLVYFHLQCCQSCNIKELTVFLMLHHFNFLAFVLCLPQCLF
jgi:hypothetical protein